MNQNEYITSDLYEAVVLKYFGHRLECVDKTQKRAEFYFIREKDSDEIIRGYRDRSLKVEPYAFSQCIGDIKNRLYNG